MGEQVSRLITWVRRTDDAVATASAPGTPVHRWTESVRAARERWIRVAEAWLATRLPASAVQVFHRARSTAARALAFAEAERTGLVGALVVLIAGWVLVRLLWEPLSWPSSAINVFIAMVTPQSCALFGPSNILSDNLCGTVLAVFTVTGALVSMAALFLLRVPLRGLANAVFGATLGSAQFLAVPLTAMVLFTVGWAGVQYHFADRPGIVADGDFPVVVGLAAYALSRYAGSVRAFAAPLFVWGASVSAPVRIGIVLLVPFTVSLATVPIWNTPVRDQMSVLVTMAVGWVLFAQPTAAPPTTGGER